jgi:hypothetical protein
MGIGRQLSDLGVWLVNAPPVANEIGSPQNSTVAGHARAHRRHRLTQGVPRMLRPRFRIAQAILRLCPSSGQAPLRYSHPPLLRPGD